MNDKPDIFSFSQPHVEPFLVERRSPEEPWPFLSNYHQAAIDEPLVYMFEAPDLKKYKIGTTKNVLNLKSRLRECARQCGVSRILALWKPDPIDVRQKERLLLERHNSSRISRESFTWNGDFISLYATFMKDADWRRYSMELVVDERSGQIGMKKLRLSSSAELAGFLYSSRRESLGSCLYNLTEGANCDLCVNLFEGILPRKGR